MSEKFEARAAIHLSLDHFRAGVDVFGPAVIGATCSARADGLEVLVELADKGMHVRRSALRAKSIHACSPMR